MPDALLDKWLSRLQCPLCGGPLAQVDESLCCTSGGHAFPIEEGIPCLVDPDEAHDLARFCAQYDALRLEEGWADEKPGYYDALPYNDITGRHTQEWALRVRSLAWLFKWLDHTFGDAGLSLLDAAAGVGWMSRILAEKHEVVAMDVNVGRHGLNAVPAARRSYLALQGMLDRIPMADDSLDLVIINAGLQYASTQHRVLQEAHRILRTTGRLVIMDSPVYPNEQAVELARQRTAAYYDKMGRPELATRYTGLTDALFLNNEWFSFTRPRRDFSIRDHLAKKIRAWLGKPVGARFPIIVGQAI